MVRVVRPPPPPVLPPLSSPPPHAATPRARAVRRQPKAATERTRKGPSSGTRYRRRRILRFLQDKAQSSRGRAPLTLNEAEQNLNAAPSGQERRLPGRYGVSMRRVAATSAINAVNMNA